MKINYNLRIEDWVNFQEYFRKKKTPLYGCMVPLLTILFICNVVLGIHMNFFYRGDSQYNWVLFVCIVLLAYLLFMQSQTRKRLMKAGNELKEENPDVFGESSIEFFEEGFEIQTKKHKKFLKWMEIENYDQTKDYVYFFSKTGYAYILPKQYVDDFPRLELILNKLNKK
ncbi:MAG: YcxB family protein [Dysgonamonadaceae bacterium]|jgi:hypothetical protein|nr:YcxB family protein [Dysgonamonadaceae bacterium]